MMIDIVQVDVDHGTSEIQLFFLATVSTSVQRTEACDEICDVSPPSFTLPSTENPCTCSHTAPQLLVTSVCVRLQEAPSPQCSH